MHYVNLRISINLTWLNIHVASCFKPERPPAPRKWCDLHKTNIKHLEDTQWSSKCLIFFAHRRPLGFATTFSQYLSSLIKHSVISFSHWFNAKGQFSIQISLISQYLCIYNSTNVTLVEDTIVAFSVSLVVSYKIDIWWHPWLMKFEYRKLSVFIE